MDPKDHDNGKPNKQASKESSQKRDQSSIDKGKGKMVAIDTDNEYYPTIDKSKGKMVPIDTDNEYYPTIDKDKGEIVAINTDNEYYSSIDKGKGKGKMVKIGNDNVYYPTIDKGKGKILAIDDNNDDFYNIHSPFLNVQYPYVIESLRISPTSTIMDENSYQSNPNSVRKISYSELISDPSTQPLCKDQIFNFLFENNIEFDVVNSVSFQELLNIGGQGPLLQSSVPTITDLKEQILTEKYEEFQSWVAKIKESWTSLGCSVILDGWFDKKKGRQLMNVLVDCQLHTVYLKSVDVSYACGDVNAMEMVIEHVLYEVGLENIVQVICYESSPWLDAVGKRVTAKHQSIFWTVSASHCLAMMLDKVASLIGWVKETINQAKRITRLLHSNPCILELLKKGNDLREDKDYDLVKFSKIKEATTFLTLENMLVWRKKLEAIFTSREWNDSKIGSSSRGRKVANLALNDKSFWSRLTIAVKGGIPIVNVLSLINDGNNDDNMPHMGILYETMDQLNETISEEIGVKKGKEFRCIVDEIWNQMLHSPLHAAGYYLNPKFFYNEDFNGDHEVVSGIMTTLGEIVRDQRTYNLITQQLELYQDGKGGFKRGMKHNIKFSPVDWWMRFGNHCPELQSFAIKVLGLSCNGSSSYELKREVAEELLSTRETNQSYKRLMQYTFVSYNIHLKELKNSGIKFNIKAHEIDPYGDWIFGQY